MDSKLIIGGRFETGPDNIHHCRVNILIFRRKVREIIRMAVMTLSQREHRIGSLRKNHMTDLIIQERCCLMTMTITMMMLITIAEI